MFLFILLLHDVFILFIHQVCAPRECSQIRNVSMLMYPYNVALSHPCCKCPLHQGILLQNLSPCKSKIVVSWIPSSHHLLFFFPCAAHTVLKILKQKTCVLCEIFLSCLFIHLCKNSMFFRTCLVSYHVQSVLCVLYELFNPIFISWLMKLPYHTYH